MSDLANLKRYTKEILTLLGKERRRLPKIAAFVFASSILDLVGIGLIAPYITLVLNPASATTVNNNIYNYLNLEKFNLSIETVLGLGLIAVFTVKTVVGIWLNRILIRFSQDQQVRLRCRLMKAFQDLPYVYYLQRNSSELIHSIQVLTSQYASVVLMPALKILSDMIVATVIISFLAWSNISALILLIVVFSPLLLGYDILFRRRLRVYGNHANDASRRIIQSTQEAVDGMKEIRVLGKEDFFFQAVRAGCVDYAGNHIRSQVISMVPRYTLDLLLVVFIVMLVMQMKFTSQDSDSVMTTLAVFGVAAIRLLPMANAFASGLAQLRYYRPVTAKLCKDLHDNNYSSNWRALQNSSKSEIAKFQYLKASNICFRYPGGNKNALEGVSLEIRRGESIGIIGTSGSGKSTLIDVLLGLLTIDKGEICYNNDSIGSVLSEWQNQVAYLPQQAFLIDNTLRRNVALGVEDNDIDDVKLSVALRQARLEELVMNLPNGVDTILGERGIRLSGGQRQRIALARAFYHGRDILVLDEATSALDNETEAEIVEEIYRLRGQKTMIVIAHRLSTVISCDRLYRLEGGRVTAHGVPSDVLNNE